MVEADIFHVTPDTGERRRMLSREKFHCFATDQANGENGRTGAQFHTGCVTLGNAD